MQEAPGIAGDGCGFALRSANVADAAVLAELIEDLNRSEGDPTGFVSAETVARDLATGRISVVVAEAEGAVIGYCLYHVGYEATYAANGLYIVDLFVVDGWRRAGVGGALIAEVARRSREEGGVFVWWTAKPGNEAANAVYPGSARSASRWSRMPCSTSRSTGWSLPPRRGPWAARQATRAFSG